VGASATCLAPPLTFSLISDKRSSTVAAEQDCIIEFAGLRIHARLPAPLPAWIARLPLCRSSDVAPPFEGSALVRAAVTIESGEARFGARYEAGVGRGIRFDWEGVRGKVQAPGMRATWVQEAGGEFVLHAALAGDRQSVSSLVQATAVAVQSALGGCLLHAAAVEVNRRVVAFIGPSGAGKSTACTQLAGARLFSWDRLLVVPQERGWQAYAFPGGEQPATAMPESSAWGLPLAGILRAVPSERCAVQPLSAGQKLLELRSAVLSGGRSAAEEGRLLEMVQALADSIPVGRLEFPLGAPLQPVVDEFVLASSQYGRDVPPT